MVQKIACPVTAKIRVFDYEKETIEYVKALENTGISMLTVHGRTISNCKHDISSSDWNIIREIKKVTKNLPIVANGGISKIDDAKLLKQYTGVDGVMSAEALLENPRLFCEEGDYEFRERYPVSQLMVVEEFMNLCENFIEGPSEHHNNNHNDISKSLSLESKQAQLKMVKSHLFKLLYRFLDVHHDIRNQMGRIKGGSLSNYKSLITEL